MSSSVLKQVKIVGELKELLQRHHDLGGVLDVAVMRLLNVAASEYDLHRQAALQFMEHQVRIGYARGTEPEKAAGERISLSEFVGPFFDFQRQQLINPWQPIGHKHYRYTVPHGWSGPADQPREFLTYGYADAFMNPPHPMRVDPELQQLFTQINACLFNGLTNDLRIYQWCTDWSDYFDAGKEWWGAFLWTVYRLGSTRIIAIGASTTD